MKTTREKEIKSEAVQEALRVILEFAMETPQSRTHRVWIRQEGDLLKVAIKRRLKDHVIQKAAEGLYLAAAADPREPPGNR